MNSSTAICIFLSRESEETALRSLHHVSAAAPPESGIDLLVNGNRALADALARYEGTLSDTPVPVRVWYIELADKANAWNRYIHDIWSGQSAAIFLDGYVMPQPDALITLRNCTLGNPHALGGTGVPSHGRSSSFQRERMQTDGGFQGNLCCLKGDVVETLRAQNIRIPVGLYRTDSLIGALLYLGLHPAKNRWDLRRVAVVPAATWKIEQTRAWRLRDLNVHARRLVRQSRGRLENLAVREHLTEKRLSPASLPRHAETLIHGWALRKPWTAAWIVLRSPLAIPWLIGSMRKETVAATAGEAVLVSRSIQHSPALTARRTPVGTRD